MYNKNWKDYEGSALSWVSADQRNCVRQKGPEEMLTCEVPLVLNWNLAQISKDEIPSQVEQQWQLGMPATAPSLCVFSASLKCAWISQISQWSLNLPLSLPLLLSLPPLVLYSSFPFSENSAFHLIHDNLKLPCIIFIYSCNLSLRFSRILIFLKNIIFTFALYTFWIFSFPAELWLKILITENHQ